MGAARWVTVNLKWADRTPSPALEALRDQVSAAYDNNKAKWRAEFPALAANLISSAKITEESYSLVDEVQAAHPELQPNGDGDTDWQLFLPKLEATNPTRTKWDDDPVLGSAIAVVKYRISLCHLKAHERENAEISRLTALVEAQQEADKAKSFYYHAACKPGTYIEAKKPDGTLVKALIGDMVKYGSYGGCCASELVDDEDTVVRYLDLASRIADEIAAAEAD